MVGTAKYVGNAKIPRHLSLMQALASPCKEHFFVARAPSSNILLTVTHGHTRLLPKRDDSLPPFFAIFDSVPVSECACV